MVSSSSELPRPSLQIKQDDKFYCRLLSKESSLTQPSFRVYYGVASGAVPFLWESQPGTPKHTASSTNLPPLTPPPSYYCSTKNQSCRKSPKSNLIQIMLPQAQPEEVPQVALIADPGNISQLQSPQAALHLRVVLLIKGRRGGVR
ncbi:unnamed protein product [Musa textilis]